jgi:mannonate dehydratase
MGVVEKDLSSDKLTFLKAIGVNHVCHLARDDFRDFGSERSGYWDAERVLDLRKHVEAHGMSLDMLTLPLNAPSVERSPLPNIILATPQRDAEIERLIKCIRAAAYARVPAVKYNFTIGGVFRTEREAGRAGASHTAFRYDKFTFRPTAAGEITAEEMWERLEYLVRKLVPVVNDLGIRIAIHPHDPPLPLGAGMDDRILRDIPSLERYLDLTGSPLFGLTFCQGSIAEGGHTTEDIVAGVLRFGHRIFMVHCRTIVGGYLSFREGFHDEGDIDLTAVIRAYQQTTPDHMLLVPDHYPKIPGDTDWGHQSKAYAIGYLKGIIRATGGETP